MDIIQIVSFGLATGILVNIFDNSPNKTGLFGAVLLGVVGAIIGASFATLLVGGATFTGLSIVTLALAVGASLSLLFVAGTLRRI
jgi:uncharacterized membrane protein YeaQ/YmgE (transglycosylase-associated protein family)